GVRAARAVVHGVLYVGALHRPDRGDDGGGTAGEPLDDLAGLDAVAHLVEGDLAFVHLAAPRPGELDDRAAGDSLEDGSGKSRGVQRAVGGDEEGVHPAEFFDAGARRGIEETHLVATVLRGDLLGK